MAGSKFKGQKEAGQGREKLTSFIKPMLAKQAAEPFDKKDWIYEIKWDGFRAIAEILNGNVKLYSRNGNSFVNNYPSITAALIKIKKNVIFVCS